MKINIEKSVSWVFLCGLFLALVCPVQVRAGGAAGEAYVADPAGRVTMNFNTGWKFYLGNASGADAKAFSDVSWTNVALPHNPRLEKELLTGNENYRGIHWYRRHFFLDNSASNKKVFIEFETGSIVTDIWVNGTAFPTHYGMNLPITVDVTSAVAFGSSENVIAVRLNNNDDASVPPGHTQAGTSGLDFMYFGGLYRNAHLYVTDKLYITDPIYTNKVASGGIFVTYSNVSASAATIQVKTHVKNESAATKSAVIKSYVVNLQNTIVATMNTTQSINANSDASVTQTATISNPSLWYPDKPVLNRLYSSVWVDNVLVDNFETRIGIRSLAWVNKAMVINGKQYPKIIGTNRHQDYPYIGNAASRSMQFRDVKNLKAGGNVWIRSGHEPAGIDLLDACDSLGVMILDCLPGWQKWNSAQIFQDRCFQNVKDMVRRGRNHPCIMAYEVALNESSQSDAFGAQTASLVKAEYPGNQSFTAGGNWSSYKNAAIDYDLYWGTGNAGTGLPLLREYGDWEFGGNTSTSRVQRLDGETKMLTGITNRMQSSNGVYTDNTVGLATWCGIDYNRGYVTPTCYAGLLDVFRLPKYVYYYYAAQRDPNAIQPEVESGPYIKIANFWTSSSPKDVTVLSNCEQVKLSLNGTAVATQKPDATFNGSNTCRMNHPPFTFKGITWASGTLIAEGLIGGVVKTIDTVKTPGAAAKITVKIDDMGRPVVADGADMVFVYASVCDASGTVVPVNNTNITFSASGPGAIVGDASNGANPKATQMGIAGALLKVTGVGAITVTASASGLTAGTDAITSLAFTEPTVPMAVVSVDKGLFSNKNVLENSVVMRTINGNVLFQINGLKNFAFDIMNVNGRVIMHHVYSGSVREITVPKQSITNGVYMMRITSANGVMSRKVAITK